MNDLERLVAIEELRALQARYVRHADVGEWPALAGLFLPDARFIPHGLDGHPRVTIAGRDGIVRHLAAMVGSGTALHHLYSWEIDIDSPTAARGLWAMEERIDRSNAVSETDATTKVRGLWAAEDWNDSSHVAATAGIREKTQRPFRTMHGYGYYRAAYEKLDGSWFIAELKLFPTKLDFSC